MRPQLMTVLDSHAARFGSRTAIAHKGCEFSYEAVRDAVNDLSKELSHVSLPRNCGVYLNNHDDNWCSKFILYLALALNEYVPILRSSSDSNVGVHAEMAFSTSNIPRLDVTFVPKSHSDFGRYFSEPLDILFTSGTTGKNKPILFSVSHFFKENHSGSPIEYRAAHLSIPFYTSTGIHAVALRAFLAGHTSVCLDTPLSWDHLAEDLSDLRSIELTATPFVLENLIRDGEDWDRTTEGLRYLKVFAGSLTDSLRERLQTRMPKCRILSIYGLSEAAAVSLKRDKMGRTFESLGKETFFRVWIEERNRWANAGEVGEILAFVPGSEGPPKVLGQELEAPLPEGWVRTGDIGIQFSDNEITFLGRSKEFITIQGVRVPSYGLEEKVNDVLGSNSCLFFNHTINDAEQVCVIAEVADATAKSQFLAKSIELPEDSIVFMYKRLVRTGLGKINRASNIKRAIDAMNTVPSCAGAGRVIYDCALEVEAE